MGSLSFKLPQGDYFIICHYCFKFMSLDSHASVCHMSAWREEGVGLSGTGVTDDWEPLFGCRELNPGTLKK